MKSKTNSNLLFIEKYRPQKISEVVSHENVKIVLDYYIKNNDFPNCILYGPAGIGKTSIILSSMKQLFKENENYNTLWINASENRNVSNIKTLLISFINNKSLKSYSNPLKVIILDEVDNLTSDSMNIVSNIINKNKNIRLCLICNYITKIPLYIQNKCLTFKMCDIDSEQILKHLQFIADQENINISDQALLKIINSNQDKDLRSIINTLQYYYMLYDHEPIIDLDIKNINNTYPEFVQKIQNEDMSDPKNLIKLKILEYMDYLLLSLESNDLYKKILDRITKL